MRLEGFWTSPGHVLGSSGYALGTFQTSFEHLLEMCFEDLLYYTLGNVRDLLEVLWTAFWHFSEGVERRVFEH
jgi:hypothetical protein